MPSYRLARLRRRHAAPLRLDIVWTTDLDAALRGADLVLSQVRPGGMAGRAADEALALSAGLPADEGLGPGGLACYLRGRAVMDRLHEAVARHAGAAPLLALTSPLGLTVARARRRYGLRCFGVCELPSATVARIRPIAERALGTRLSVAHAGLNHQGWLHEFRDRAGTNRVDEVAGAAEIAALLAVDAEVIRRERAIPLPYLRLYYHPDRVVAEQRRRPETRGVQLGRWVARAEAAYLGEHGPDHAALESILAERSMHWYAEGVVPALSAFLGEEAATVPLNLPNEGAIPGVGDDAVVEVGCRVSRDAVAPLAVGPLPEGPLRLLQPLLAYEAAVLRLAEPAHEDDVADALARHPLVADGRTAAVLARRMLWPGGAARPARLAS